MLSKIKPYLITAAVVVAVLLALKHVAPESLKSQVRL